MGSARIALPAPPSNNRRGSEKMEWMRIGKRAKTGRTVDIWSKSLGRCTDMKWEQLSRTNGFFSCVNAGYSCVRDATHYLIPQPPEEQKDAE